METQTFLAPAKINLNLRILDLNKSTGFHDLESLMVPLSLHDNLTITPTDDPSLKLDCNDTSLPSDSSNLAWRAADLFLRTAEIPHGAYIQLTKNIPHGAGLGGGSSDAATVLTSLNSLTGSPLSTTTLENLGAQLGSDIPFFIRCATQNSCAHFATGRGEILAPAPLSRPLDLLLLKPPFPVETGRAYRHWADGIRCPAEWTKPQKFYDLDIFNDLESPVFARHLVLPVIKAWLLEQPSVAAAAMSGSGSCMFAILENPDAAAPLADSAKLEFGSSLWTTICSATK